ncbi:hypothetical protein ACIQ6Y_19300 [Streptomyces sp. NPDC096205]|uniref:hypothetical protein n=1 Tax=Streptomyces sp. NPDC096205 TaxID=3366081 RepID=UPI00380AAABE
MTTRRTASWLALALCAAGLAVVPPAQAAEAAGEQVLVFGTPGSTDAVVTVEPTVKQIVIEAWGGAAAGEPGPVAPEARAVEAGPVEAGPATTPTASAAE